MHSKEYPLTLSVLGIEQAILSAAGLFPTLEQRENEEYNELTRISKCMLLSVLRRCRQHFMQDMREHKIDSLDKNKQVNKETKASNPATNTIAPAIIQNISNNTEIKEMYISQSEFTGGNNSDGSTNIGRDNNAPIGDANYNCSNQNEKTQTMEKREREDV